jgi:regulator of nucleoside diphosphate kinase
MNVSTPVAATLRTLTELDQARLLTLLRRHPEHAAFDDLDRVLDLAEVVSSREIAPDVVTMKSQVLLQEAGHERPTRLTLSYPDDADAASGCVSVLSPVGTALLGQRAGATARWRTPRGDEASGRIVELVHQPEASGDYTA